MTPRRCKQQKLHCGKFSKTNNPGFQQNKYGGGGKRSFANYNLENVN